MKLRLLWIVVGIGCLVLGQPASFAQQKDGKRKAKPGAAKKQGEDWGSKQENQPWPLTGKAKADNRPTPKAETESLGWLLMRVVLYLVLVIGLLYASAWLVRRFLPARQALMGHAAVTVLGRSYLSSRMQIFLVQVGSQVLVIGASADQMTTLATVTDPDDVRAIIGASEQPRSPVKGFEGLFKGAVGQFDTEAEPGTEFENEAERLREKLEQRRKEESA